MTPLVAVGCSLGGFRAIGTLLSGLPRDFPAALAIVQHRASHGTEDYCEAIGRNTALRVVEAEDKQPPQPGTVYVAPAGYHLLVDADAFSLSVDDPVNFAQPSIDVLFESVADACGSKAIGVVLSGASRDGSEGARRLREAGGRIVVQDPAEAECSVLPVAALDAVRNAAVVLPLVEITPWLVNALR